MQDSVRGWREMACSGEDMSMPKGKSFEDSEGGGGNVNDKAMPASEAVERKGRRKMSIPKESWRRTWWGLEGVVRAKRGRVSRFW